ncbi:MULTISPECIES: hypothetical protein [Chryseobacterium]|uniref:Carboxypeptidase-like protein n=1 Tax=Chryseobacterium geocarposphaerae TaxID=1416776 RepID=A0ABU1LG84_9FLAO|nr:MULTISPECIES: hypothetical protein [Chryseobacterium]MDR6405709.1 hypothetical protein [Chryseobacterium geocarposphaerae]MDR6699129.1 hypothetical protein [Chryseobacterium ginsenosidimutans]
MNIKNEIKIHNPCPENWEAMQDASEGKFCEKCSKCVVDFTDKTEGEIQDIFKTADEKEICGRISTRSLSMVAAGIILVTNLTFVQAQTKNNVGIATEQKAGSITKLSGKLIFKRTKTEIQNAEVFFICKSKYIKTTTDENGNFTLEIPNELIEKKNVLYFDFEKLNKEIYENPNRKVPNEINADIYENTTVIFTKKEEISNKEFQIDSEFLKMGAVVVTLERPPDYYYFNGKSISERKFEKLRKENPNYQFFFFKDKEAEIIAGKSYLNSLQLLYSN